MSPPRTVHVVVPDGIDDLTRPSGGNTYDKRLCQALATAGWSVHALAVPGSWPWGGADGHRALVAVLGALPERSVVLVDGLVASTAPEVLVPAARRLRLVVLMHMPIGLRNGCDGYPARERAVLAAPSAVITSSGWTRRWLLTAYGLDPGRVHVAHPGVDAASPAVGSDDGDRMLCVGAVTPAKGHDVLMAALARIADHPWRCVCVGALTVTPGFVADLRRGLHEAGLEDRVELTGPLTGRDLDAAYAGADALVLASRAETYGMVVTEALARALPVVAADVGGVPEALGATSDGRRPGLLVPPGDVTALADGLRRWLCDADLRGDLRDAARRRRTGLSGWPETAGRVARILQEVAA